MRQLLVFILAVGLFSACSKDDEKVEVKDYNLKTFEADLAYDAAAEHGTVQYTRQTYFSFNSATPVETGTYGTDTWTDFFLVPDTSAYNVSTDVQDWDLLLSFYTEALDDEGTIIPYGVVGVLINTGENIKVGKIEYTGSEDPTAIADAFAALTPGDVGSLGYSGDINAIGHTWKSFSLSQMVYTVNSNWFYIVKLGNGDVYKLRFTGFYGTSTSQRVIKFEYQLMQ